MEFANLAITLTTLGVVIKVLLNQYKYMPITQQQFDSDLAAFLAAFQALCTAIDNSLGNQPQADLSAEDQQILTASQTAQAELAKLNPPPQP